MDGQRFDWSLSMRELEKRHLPTKQPIVQKPKTVFEYPEIHSEITEELFKEKFKTKYSAAYAIIQSCGYDMAGWIYRNLIIGKL